MTKTPTPLAIILDRSRMTQSELAKATGFSLSYISDIYHGRRRGSVEVRGAIADALRIPIFMLDQPDTEQAG